MQTQELGGVTVVLPSLNPTEKLIQVVSGLIGEGFADILIINDGSDEAHLEPFRQLAELPQCRVLTHETNRGKGAGLKTAFRYLLENEPGLLGVVTVDGDGQHLPRDVQHCAVRMLEEGGTVMLGVRSFAREHVPFKSYWGNTITSFAFRALCGIRLSDTQTGLRAIPAALLPALLDVGGERFEYETNMLLDMKRVGIPFEEVPIETVYEGTNEGSHFRPVRDSVRIYALILKYAASGLLSFLLDNLFFLLALHLLGAALGPWKTVACYVVARLLSSFFNYNANRRLVFQNNSGYGPSLLRYYLLCIPQMLISAGLVEALARLSGVSAAHGLLTLLKIAVDTALFFVSFQLQREWVFRQKTR